MHRCGDKVRKIGAWLAATVMLALGGAVAQTATETPAAPSSAAPASATLAGVEELSSAVEALSKQVIPSIVLIQAKGYVPVQGGEEGGLLSRRSSAGSGVILDPDGYVVTNAHVVLGARSIQVQLAPERRSPQSTSVLKSRGKVLGAQLVGIDRETDLAVLKVDAKGLPALPLGDSEALLQGQLVFAFGSPFGLAGSVTMGIVSSAARQVEPDHPMVYIQTDAAINPGNSGGALVNASGQVVGINTFILSRSGGNEGVGFAAPSNIVRNVYEQLRATGHVRRGMIGVNAQTLTPAIAAGLGLPRDWGVVLADVTPSGPAAKAGLRPGDLVLQLDGKVMENGRQMDVNVYRRKVGEQVKLLVQRGGQELTFQVPVVERNNDPERFMPLVSPDRNLIPKLGILGLDVDAKLAQNLDLQLRKASGVLVAASSNDTFFREEVFFPGDVIHAVNGKEIATLAALRDAIGGVPTGGAIACLVERRGAMVYVAVEAE